MYNKQYHNKYIYILFNSLFIFIQHWMERFLHASWFCLLSPRDWMLWNLKFETWKMIHFALWTQRNVFFVSFFFGWGVGVGWWRLTRFCLSSKLLRLWQSDTVGQRPGRSAKESQKIQPEAKIWKNRFGEMKFPISWDLTFGFGFGNCCSNDRKRYTSLVRASAPSTLKEKERKIK